MEKSFRCHTMRNPVQQIKSTYGVLSVGKLVLKSKHRLLCGDSTKREDVERLLDGQSPSIMATDPPYGVNYDPTWREGASRTEYIEAKTDTNLDWSDAWELFPGDIAYIWHSDRQRVPIQVAMERLGFQFRAELVWMKTVWPMGRGHWKSRHEPCIYFVRNGKQAKWNDVALDAYDDTTVLNARPPGAGFGRTKEADSAECGITSHACQKPVACQMKILSRHGGSGDAVYEPFAGSGTTIVACEQLHRACFAMEMEPRYCDIILKRYENLTGKQAIKWAP